MPNLRLCLSIRSSALYEVNDRAPSMYAMHIYDELETRKTNKKGDFFFTNSLNSSFRKCVQIFVHTISQIFGLHCSKFSKRNYTFPLPFAKTGELFWPDFPKFHFFDNQGVRTKRTSLNN